MKTFIAALTSFVAFITASSAFDFSYGYKTIYDANADLYITGTTNVRKYTEPFGSPAALYWGPTANNVEGLLTMRFTFATPSTEIMLKADLASFNFAQGGGYGSGASSMWGSTDGVNWTLLLDNPKPATIDSYKTYNQNVPASLLGTTLFFVQVRLTVQGAPNTSYTDAQFSRADTSRTDNVFQLNANLAPTFLVTVTTPTATSITATGATLGGNVTSDGGATITERGVVYSPAATNSNPEVGGAGVMKLSANTSTTDVFTTSATDLTPGTSYRFKAYAINSQGTAYSSVASFLTLSNDANLRGLVLDGFGFSPAFANTTATYAAMVQRSDGTLRIRPTSAHPGASLFARVNGGGWVPVSSGSLSLPLPLEFGDNLVEVRVIAQDDATEQLYSLGVFRNQARPDAMVGLSLAFMVGANVYESALAQQLPLASSKARPVSGYVRAVNRGNVADRIALQGRGGSRFFGVDYRDSNSALVPAAVRAGLHRTPDHDPGDSGDWLRVDVKPVKKRIVVKKGKRTVTLRKVHTVLIQANSVLDPAVGDGVSIRVETR